MGRLSRHASPRMLAMRSRQRRQSEPGSAVLLNAPVRAAVRAAQPAALEPDLNADYRPKNGFVGDVWHGRRVQATKPHEPSGRA